MRLVQTAVTFCLLANVAMAAAPVVTENLSGTFSGSNTVDSKGYFGKKGADLFGKKVAVYVQYVPRLMGASQECRNNACTYNTSVQMPDTPGSLLMAVTVDGRRLVYSPRYEGAVFFATQAPYQLTVDSDAFSGFGLGFDGLQLGVVFSAAPMFGQKLSPGNQPVMKRSSDTILFYKASSESPDEQLTFQVDSATK